MWRSFSVDARAALSHSLAFAQSNRKSGIAFKNLQLQLKIPAGVDECYGDFSPTVSGSRFLL
jgi:hypothetical protein